MVYYRGCAAVNAFHGPGQLTPECILRGQESVHEQAYGYVSGIHEVFWQLLPDQK